MSIQVWIITASIARNLRIHQLVQSGLDAIHKIYGTYHKKITKSKRDFGNVQCSNKRILFHLRCMCCATKRAKQTFQSKKKINILFVMITLSVTELNFNVKEIGFGSCVVSDSLLVYVFLVRSNTCYKAFRHVENLFIQRFFIYSSKVCTYCARIAIGCTIIKTLDE